MFLLLGLPETFCASICFLSTAEAEPVAEMEPRTPPWEVKLCGLTPADAAC